jgi:hypothetical protein
LVALALACLCVWSPAVARAQAPLLAPPQVIAGPSPAIISLGGMSIARDGTGGLVYLARGTDGVAHVFVSSLTGGQFQSPQRLDVGSAFSGPSSQPVLAAGLGGVLLVAFINSGELYVVDRASSNAAWQPPLAMHALAANPSLQLSNPNGKAYLAFTATDGSGQDVLVDYYSAGSWAPAQSALNLVAGDNAGAGAGRPEVAAASDGVGMVVWGEGGHLYLRRVWGVVPSVLAQQLDTDPAQLPAYGPAYKELSVGSAAIGTGGDSSYATVAFDEKLQAVGGGPAQTRVLMARVVAATVTPAVPVDGLSPGSASADQPSVAVNEYGRGFVTAAQTQSNRLFAGQLNTNDALGTLGRIDSQPNSALPFAAPGIAGLSSMLIAWQQSTSSGAAITLRYAPTLGNLGPEQVVSNPLQGPTDAAAGLFTGGDGAGDAAAAWVQGSGAMQSIVVAQLFTPPGAPAPSQSLTYSRSATPVLSWSPSRDSWGPVTYAVSLDGQPFAQTQNTSLPISGGLIDGPHRWQVAAVNLAGAQTAGPNATVWVDTTPPRLQVTLGGRARAHKRIRLGVLAKDIPASLERGAQASGIANVRVRWGDRSAGLARHGAWHRFTRSGLYRVVVSASDRAGNTVTIAHYLRILP